MSLSGALCIVGFILLLPQITAWCFYGASWTGYDPPFRKQRSFIMGIALLFLTASISFWIAATFILVGGN